jgi:DNA-binding HxlR family transcriptional regulator
MRTYGQFCALAKALDVVGDRWTLLIVRELLTWKRARYTDLKSGLPGIASNLLSERLRELEEAGVIVREDEPPPVATTLYALTERGTALAPVLRELGRWGAPLLSQAPKSDDVRGHWIGLPAELFLRDAAPSQPPVALEIRSEGQTVTLVTADGAIQSRVGRPEKADAVLAGPAREIARVLLAGAPLADARRRGVTYTGNRQVLERFERISA